MKFELMPMFWLLFTLLTYGFSRWLYRRTGRYLLSPLILVPALLLAVAVPLHTGDDAPCVFFVKDTNKLPDVLEITRIFN